MFPLRSRSRSQAGIDLDSAPQKVSCLDAFLIFLPISGLVSCRQNYLFREYAMTKVGHECFGVYNIKHQTFMVQFTLWETPKMPTDLFFWGDAELFSPGGAYVTNRVLVF